MNAARPQVPDVGVQRASDDEAVGDVAARVKGRRVSCDSTATSGGVMTSTSESTSSPRVVSSTSDDFDCDDSGDNEAAAAELSDVTGSS